MAEEEYKTYQPKWEEKKLESERHHHHHHHHHNYGKSSSSHTNGWGGWLKMRDKQAYYGLMLLISVILLFGVYSLVKYVVTELQEMPHGDPSQELKVDELRVKMVDEADAIYLGDSLARELKMDTLVHSVKGDAHNVYRPPRKKDNVTIDDREWKDIFKNLRRWFKANGGDPKFIAGCVVFGLFLLVMIIYAIHKIRRRHGR